MKNKWMLVIIVLLIAALACGSGGSTSEITNSTLKKVCRGEGVEEAAVYGSAGDGTGPYPVVAFRRASEDDAWFLIGPDDMGEGFPPEWRSSQGTQTELVLCLTTIERELVQECAYTAQDDQEGGEIQLMVELYNTTYDVVLRNARTAEQYDTTTIEAATTGVCEQYALEVIDQDTRIIDAPPGASLIPFLEPWVEE